MKPFDVLLTNKLYNVLILILTGLQRTLKQILMIVVSIKKVWEQTTGKAIHFYFYFTQIKLP